MKREFNFITSLLSSFFFLNCPGQGGITSFKLLNPEEVFGTTYEEKHPFKMIPSATHAPLLSREGQINLEFNYSQGFSGNLAFASTKSGFIFFQYDIQRKKFDISEELAYIRQTKDYGNNDIDTSYFTDKWNHSARLRQNTFTIGGGVFVAKKNKVRFDVSGSVGFIKVESKYDYNAMQNGNVISYGLSLVLPSVFSGNNSSNNSISFSEVRNGIIFSAQGDLGYVNKYFEAAVTSRFSLVNFTKQELEMDYFLKSYEMNKNLLVFEPAVKIGGGFKAVRLFLQYNVILPLDNNDVEWASSKVEAGVLLRIADLAYKSVNK